MAAMPSSVRPPASLLGASTACRSCNSWQQQQQQHAPANVICSSFSSSSSSQLCRRSTLLGGLATRIGPSDTSNLRAAQFWRVNPTSRVRAAPSSTEFEIVSGEGLLDDDEPFLIPDTIPSEGETSSSPGGTPGGESFDTTGLPSQFEDAARLTKEGAESAGSSPPTGHFPNVPPPADVAPTFPDVLSAPSTSAPDDVLQAPAEQFPTKVGGTGGIFSGVQEGLKSLQDAATNSVDGAVNAARDAIYSAKVSVLNAFDSVNESTFGAVKSVSGSLEKSVDDLRSNVGNAQEAAVDNAKGYVPDFTSVFRVGTPANDALKQVVEAVGGATTFVFTKSGNFIAQGYGAVKDNVPQDIHSFLDTAEEKASLITGPAGSAVDQTFVIFTDAEKAVGLDPGNPAIPAVVFLGGSLFLGYTYFNNRYGGYSGDLRASAALDLLKSESDTILVDIRPQDVREAEGVPDFRRSFRSKLATVDIVKVGGPVRGMLKNVNEIEALLTAAVIRNLKNVNGKTQIIVLDSEGSQSKQIARGLRKSGVQRAYLVDGGFKAWASAGLRFKAEGPPNRLRILQEDAAAIVEEVKPTAVGVLAVLLGLAAGTYAVAEWEKALQFIGLLGLSTTIYSRVKTYRSPDDAKADLRVLQKPLGVFSEGIGWISGLVEPKKLQLATSPASSNVQGRVIQAAAKHGAVPPELELTENEEDKEGGNERRRGEVEAVEDDSVEDRPGSGGNENADEGSSGDISSQNQHTTLQEPQ